MDQETAPFVHLVPKKLAGNLDWRARLVRGAVEDEEFRRSQWMMCSRDIWYWINSYVWTYDPRLKPSVIPFITYKFQDHALKELVDAIGDHDILVEKSRDMGASWVITLALLWYWQFSESPVSFLLGSRKEELVDKRGDPKALYWKVDMAMQRQPKWLLPSFTRSKLQLTNKRTGSTITGESTNADFARGDRLTAIMLDEFAAVENGYQILNATADATTCRIFNSTPKGTGNAFYTQRQKPGMRVLTFHWSQHPVKGRGRRIEPISGKLTSAWYEEERRRRAHPVEVAQELDIDYLGSDYQFFSSDMLDEHEKLYCRDPLRVGNLELELQNHRVRRFEDRENGPFAMWISDPKPGESYIIGCDIATGTRASESVASVVSVTTGHKIACLAANYYRPDELARIVVAMCHWFNDAFLVWEANGPGREFGLAALDTHYRNIYYRRQDKNIDKLAGKMSDVPGWFSTKDNKNILLGEYRTALSTQKFINPCRTSVRQCREYVFLQNQSVAHSQSQNDVDPSAFKENHGDRVIADALCWFAMKHRDVLPGPKKPSAVAGSFLWRREQKMGQLEKQKAW